MLERDRWKRRPAGQARRGRLYLTARAAQRQCAGETRRARNCARSGRAAIDGSSPGFAFAQQAADRQACASSDRRAELGERREPSAAPLARSTASAAPRHAPGADAARRALQRVRGRGRRAGAARPRCARSSMSVCRSNSASTSRSRLRSPSVMRARCTRSMRSTVRSRAGSVLRSDWRHGVPSPTFSPLPLPHTCPHSAT